MSEQFWASRVLTDGSSIASVTARPPVSRVGAAKGAPLKTVLNDRHLWSTDPSANIWGVARVQRERSSARISCISGSQPNTPSATRRTETDAADHWAGRPSCAQLFCQSAGLIQKQEKGGKFMNNIELEKADVSNGRSKNHRHVQLDRICAIR